MAHWRYRLQGRSRAETAMRSPQNGSFKLPLHSWYAIVRTGRCDLAEISE